GQLRFGQRTLVRATAGITLLFGLGATACTGPQASPTPAPSAGQVAPLVVQPIEEGDARWVLLPERSEPSVALPYDRGTTAFITKGLRVLESLAGSLERAAERLPGSNTKVLPLPAHLGHGFLFHSDLEAETVLWRAESWTAELRPLARLPERARQVSIGF